MKKYKALPYHLLNKSLAGVEKMPLILIIKIQYVFMVSFLDAICTISTAWSSTHIYHRAVVYIVNNGSLKIHFIFIFVEVVVKYILGIRVR